MADDGQPVKIPKLWRPALLTMRAADVHISSPIVRLMRKTTEFVRSFSYKSDVSYLREKFSTAACHDAGPDLHQHIPEKKEKMYNSKILLTLAVMNDVRCKITARECPRAVYVL